jgi:2-oxoglutarate dehydrogenase E1 component
MLDKDSYKNLQATSCLGSDSDYVDGLYEDFLADPQAVSPEWRTYFEGLRKEMPGVQEVPHRPVQDKFFYLSQHKMAAAPEASGDLAQERKQAAVSALVNAYRRHGHLIAHLDPLKMQVHPAEPELTLAYYGLSDADLDTVFQTGFSNGHPSLSLREIFATLKHTYADTIGVEYMYITNQDELCWLQSRLEGTMRAQTLAPELRVRTYEQLTAAEGLERYLHTKFVGQKRFSLEGGDAMIPFLDEMILRAGKHAVKELVIGMAHRGRLNVLVNIFGKAPKDLFSEFEGKKEITLSSGDVKYHQGFSSDVQGEKGPIHLALAFNPSHLEIVSPVVEGSVRARQDRYDDKERDTVVPLIIHGDAAVAGQGVVMETFNMSQTRGYTTGGTVHLVVNNQIGFTTSNPHDARSTLYCTDVAKMIEAPVFHVNADDPDAVIFIAQLAMDYRMQFNKDVVIDLMCYRRLGHNEADEPAATQPLMYQNIREHKTARELYANTLIKDGLLTQAQADQILEAYRAHLDSGENVVKHLIKNPARTHVDWSVYTETVIAKPVDTAISQAEYDQCAQAISQVPANIVLQKQVGKVYEDRAKMAEGVLPLDWGFAENLAYATLLKENFAVRISGQDVGRGTFAHRHAVLHDQVKDQIYRPLDSLTTRDFQFTLVDSLLSEEAVLGFEYGYSTTEPRTLVIWEAQFGDFANGAQVVIDQFISSGETKWGRYSGLVMLLPHGYEGMGPEHSSARLERYLQLCAEHNMQVCVPTTPAQTFHMLRRQMLQPFRKPLIVMTPKSLLRHRLATSTEQELIAGHFQELIPEIDALPKDQVSRVVVCSGKVYYDLLQQRRDKQLQQVAIVRVEQLYPFPEVALRELLASYPYANEVVWCQEEPKNQGAWYCSNHHLYAALAPHQHLMYAGREASASPAVGYHSLHVEQQNKLVADALGL